MSDSGASLPLRPDHVPAWNFTPNNFKLLRIYGPRKRVEASADEGIGMTTSWKPVERSRRSELRSRGLGRSSRGAVACLVTAIVNARV